MTKNSKFVYRSEVTSYDVAELAQVSQATVSRVLNGKTKKDSKTYRRVKEACEALGYTPNAIARSLISSTTNMVGLLIPPKLSPFYSKVVGKFVEKLESFGKRVMVFDATTEQGIDTALRSVVEYRVEALIVTYIEISSENIKRLADYNVPTIFFNRSTLEIEDEINQDSVSTDNRAIGREAAEYLIGRGHKKIVCLGGEKGASTSLLRTKGFIDGMSFQNIKPIDIVYGDYRYEVGFEQTLELVKKYPYVDSIFCAADLLALGCMDALRYRLGKRIPEDISVIGVGDIEMASWLSYDLTTFREPVMEMIDLTCDILIDRLNNKLQDEKKYKKQITSKLVVRSSTK